MPESQTAVAVNPHDEIAMLVRRLHETQQQLQELAGGEVDAVVLPTGHSYLMREAQERLHHSEVIQRQLASTQAAILNALPAQIALVDEHGFVLSVNERWRHCATANVLQSPRISVGQNYLEICDRARGACAAEAHRAAAGIRAVLAGAVKEFALEYLCPAPTRPRWFELMARPLERDGPDGAVVMHLDITERKLTEDVLQRQQTELRVLFDLIPAKIVFKDTANVFLRVNQRFAETLGKSVEQIEGKSSREVFPQDSARFDADDLEVIRSGKPELGVVENDRDAEGNARWRQTDKVPVRGRDGKVVGIVVMAQDITERKQAETETRALAERLTTTLESLTEGFYTVDRDWRLTYVNHEAERLLHRARAELLGTNLWDQFPETKGTPLQTALERAQTENVVVQIEESHPPLGGWWEFRIFPSAQGLAVYFRDVSEQRQARESQRVSEERFRLFSQATNDTIWDWDVATNQLRWNEGFEAQFGFRRDEIEPTREAWTSRIHPDDRARVLDAIHRSIEAGEEKWSGDYRFLRKDGRYAYVLDRGYVIRDPAGYPVRMIGGMTDLTERKEAADRIAEQAALLDAASDAIILIDLADRIVLWNRSAEQIFGWTAAEVVGKESRELLHTEPAKFDDALAVLRQHDHWRGELEKRSKDGRTLTMDVRWTLVRDDAGQPKSILAINTDITERKKHEAQFRRMQRMESIGTLAGGIAHDLNNILAPILMSVGLLQREVTSELGRDMLGTLEVCSKRGAELVRQVLTFARGVEGQRIVVNPVLLVSEIQKIIRETFPKNIDFKFQPAADLWTVTGDPTQLHQVFMNLCVNARDAMPQGGTLAVTMGNIVVDDVYAGMNVESKPGAYVTIQVSDTGTGIPPEIRDRIFEPFFTTKEIGKGTGLGLSTTVAIVRSHGGFIQLYSEPGRGTKFTVYLPANPTTATAGHDTVAPTDFPHGQGELILVVDDEEGIRNIAQKTLTRFGYRVLLAANGAEAVAIYATQRDEIAVVLTDMAMPVMDGASTIAALTGLNPRVKIIGSSGLAPDSGVPKTVGASVQYFIPKPYTAEKMLTTLARILREPA